MAESGARLDPDPATPPLHFDVYREIAAREQLARQFATAQPFPHLVLRDALTLDPGIMEKFPDPDWPGWLRYTDGYQPEKLCCSDLLITPEPFRAMLRELNERPFLQFLEDVTGVGQLLVDPYFEGGGLHVTGPGGVLVPHTDFHLYPRLGLYRRINVLVYLNPVWPAEWGGNLELWDKQSDSCLAEVVPEWGTVVVFATDDRSLHGFTRPVAEGHWRRSLATYYYTAAETPGYSGDYTTHWRTDTQSARGVGKLRRATWRGLLKGSRALSMAAHAIDPSLGRQWIRVGLDARRRATQRDVIPPVASKDPPTE